MHAHAPRPARRLTITGAVLAGVLVLPACTGAGTEETESDRSGGAPEPVGADFAAPGARDLAKGVRLGDQSDQSLTAVARRGERVVAVGADESFNTTLPLFLVSADGGGSWQRADAATSSGDASGGESPSAVAAGSDGFVALGAGRDGRPAAWTSPEGASWTRLETDREVFRRTDSVVEVRAFDGTFYAVGTSRVPSGRSLSAPVLWTSSDGSSWRRTDLREHGVDEAGSAYASDVAVLDGQIVVAGGVEDDSLVEQPNRIVVWRSSDEGRTFTADATPPDFAGGFRAYVRELTVDGSRLVMAASGDGATTDTWDGVVMASSGRSWRKVGTPLAFGGRAEEHPSVLVGLGKGWLMAANTEGGDEDALVGTGSGLGAFTTVRHDTLAGPGSQHVNDAVSAGREALLVGSTTSSGSSEAMIWRLTGTGLSPVTLPDEAGGGRPTAEVAELVGADGGFVALGNAAESPVAWSAEDFDAWRATGLPGRSAAVGYSLVQGATALANGDVLAVGTVERELGSSAGVWLGSGRRWQRLDRPQFANRSETGYGSVQAVGVAASDRGVVVAANAYVNGVWDARPMVASADGRRWTLSTAASTVPLTSADEYYDRTPYADFRAPANGSVWMQAAVATDAGFVIGGQRGAAGEGVAATVWRSTDGRVWGGPEALPAPTGAYATGVSSFATGPEGLVATGWFQESVDAEDNGWVSWTSRDQGRTWEVGQVVSPSEAGAQTVVAVPGGFVALGSTGPAADREAAAWTSTDGREWTAVELDLERGTGPGNQFLVSGVVDGETLRLVGADVPPQGGGYYAASVPVPEP
jgi:hypothetical protein